MTRQAVVAVVSAMLVVGLVHAAGGATVSDLTIAKTDAAPTYTAGDSVIYTIVVGNAGPDAALGVTVSDAVTALPQVASATWTCASAGGATCAAGPVTGNITGPVDLPVGGTATFTLVVTTKTTATGSLVNTATVTAASGTTDPTPANNTATDTDTAAEIFVVATTGTDSPTCGNSAVACKTVQAAITNASDGDTVVVRSGTYNECPVVPAGRALRIESDEFRLAGTNAATILDGTGVCDPENAFGPVLTLTKGSMLRGVTIKGGGDSGVVGLGEVTITDNVITGNASTANGGGIRVSLGGNAVPELTTRIAGNTITNNKSAGAGAGIFVNAVGDGQPSVVAIAGNTLIGNTAGDGTAGVLGGGITVFSDTVTASDSSSVTITSNTIDGNVAQNAVGDATLAYGGGLFVVTGHFAGAGTETVTIGGTGRGNVVRNNVSEGFGGGMAVDLRPGPSGRHTVEIDANTITANNGMYGGGGIHAVVAARDLPAGATPGVVLRVTANVITGNHAQPDLDESVPAPVTLGGGLSVELDSDRTPAAAIEVEISGNNIRLNDASHGGGASLLASADDDPASDGNTAPAQANISFHNNLVAKNAASDASASGASGGGIYAAAVARGGSASARIAFDFVTVVANETELGAGGIELTDSHPANSIGSTGTTAFTLSNSIIASNEGFGVGGTVLPSASTTVSVSYTDAFGNFSGNYEAQLGIAPGTNGNIAVDPALDALFLPRLCGPTVDAGDPALSPALEPLPNGARVNLGHLGNTASATRTFPDVNGDGTVDGLDILGIAVAFSATLPDPRYFVAADRDLNDTVDGNDLAFVSAFYAQSCP